MRAPLRKMGNSSGVIIPKPVLAQIGVETGDDFDLSVEQGKITLVPIKRAPRAGWIEAAKALADSGDDGLVWPEFSNEDDVQLEW